MTIVQRWWLSSLAGVLAVGGCALWWNRQIISQPLTIRVGVDHSPPFYSIHPDGSVTGLAIDVLNEAARRRGIRLIWTPLHDIPLDDALRQRKVQLWPLAGASSARAKEFYLSKPWLEGQFVLVSRQEHPIRNVHDAEGQTVAHARLRTTTALARRFLYRSNLTVRLYRADAIQAVCSNEAAAALVESRTVDAILLSRPPGCEKVNFHMSGLPGVTAPLSIAAVPEVRVAAAALRNEITHLTQDGFLSARLEEWSPFSAEGERSIWAEDAANQRSRIYSYFLLVIGSLAVALAWGVQRARRLRNLAQRAAADLRESQRRFTAFMDHSPAVAFMKDAGGRLLYANRAWSEVAGVSPQEAYGKNDFALWPHDVAHRLRAADLELLTGTEPLQWVERIPTPARGVRAMLTVKFPFASQSGQRFVGGTAIDVTEREDALAHLAASEARYRELFEQNPLPAWVCDRRTLSFLNVNEAALRRYGWTRQDFLSGMRLSDILAQTDVSTQAEEELDLAHAQRRRWKHVTKDGMVLSVDVTSYPLEYEGNPARLMIVSDVTELENMLEQLRLSEERWQLALGGAGDALWDWDLATGTVFRSPTWRTMLGYEQQEVGDRREDLIRLLHPDDLPAVEGAIEAHLAKRTAVLAVDYRLRHKNGTWRWIRDRGQAVWDERGRARRIAGSHTDITERKAAESLLEMEARTDPLTGLMNRREFNRKFTKLVAAARAARTPLTACVCDLDCFKDVNDSHGHAAGDDVLIEFAAILRQNLRKTDVVARVGGDEFLLALSNTGSVQTQSIVERIREQLHAISFKAGSEVFRVSSSFGIAQLREQHADGAALMAEADAMLYRAKSSGRNRTIAA